MNFSNWIDTFNAEKNIDTDAVLEVEGPSGYNAIPVGALVEVMKGAPATEQAGIKRTIIKLDFLNQPILPYYEHLARAIAL